MLTYYRLWNNLTSQGVDIIKGLGERIHSIRKSKKLNQEEFGNLLSISKATISLYENDAREPDVETLIKIASIGDVSINFLCTGSDPNSADNISSNYFTKDDIDLCLKIKQHPELKPLISKVIDGAEALLELKKYTQYSNGEYNNPDFNSST